MMLSVSGLFCCSSWSMTEKSSIFVINKVSGVPNTKVRVPRGYGIRGNVSHLPVIINYASLFITHKIQSYVFFSMEPIIGMLHGFQRLKGNIRTMFFHQCFYAPFNLRPLFMRQVFKRPIHFF